MKATKSVALLMIFMTVVFLAFGTVGCDGSGNNFDVSGQENDGKTPYGYIATAEDINSLVTDDDKLVINYYDAYVWVVYFAEDGSIDRMVYIYDFETSDNASNMVDKRKSELASNKTMTVTSAKSIDNFVVIELTDSSFENVSREILENNFSQLIVM